MAQSLSKLYLHIVFHIGTMSPKIKKETESELYAYIGAILKDNGSMPIIIKGTDDHVHVLCVLSKNMVLAQLVEEIKRHSSRWIKTKTDYNKHFSWQGGYGAFSVSASMHDRTKQYIEKQKDHHQHVLFREEYILFLKEYKIDYNEEYVFRD